MTPGIVTLTQPNGSEWQVAADRISAVEWREPSGTQPYAVVEGIGFHPRAVLEQPSEVWARRRAALHDVSRERAYGPRRSEPYPNAALHLAENEPTDLPGTWGPVGLTQPPQTREP